MSDLERAQEWLESNCGAIVTPDSPTATRLAALLAEVRADEVRKLLGHLRGGDGSEFDTYLAENLKKPLVLQGFLEGRLEGLSNG